MVRRRTPGRPRPVVPAIGASAGVLGLAALVAALDTVVPATGGSAAASADVSTSSIDAAWDAGPLQLPGIGVTAPMFEAAYATLTAPASTSAAWPTPLSASTPAARATSEPSADPADELRVTPPPLGAARTPEAPGPGVGTVVPPAPPVDEPDAPPEDPTPTPGPTPGPTRPVDPPPAEEPPAEEPPAEQPPAEEPPSVPTDVDRLIGEAHRWVGAEGGEIATVVVEEFLVDVACTAEGAAGPDNGHFVAVRVRMTTGASVPADLALDAASFTVPDALATDPATAAAGACLTGTEAFPAGPLAAGQEYAGLVVLDLAATTGSITYRPDPAAAGSRWSF